MRLTHLRRSGAYVRSAAVIAFASLGAGCHLDAAPSPDANVLYIFTTFANPTVAVSVNGNSLGTILNQFTGTVDCVSLNAAIGSGAVVATTIRRGEHYKITWDYGGGNGTQSDEFDATEDAMAAACLLEGIDPP